MRMQALSLGVLTAGLLSSAAYAATVTGSPVENACRLIKAYENEGRGYYGAALAILGRDPEGGAVVDSPIVIRSADVGLDGSLKVTAGATLVRDSDPAYEVAETHAKAGGILSAFGLVDPPTVPAADVAELAADEDDRMLPTRVHAMVLVSKLHKPTLRALAYARASRPNVLEGVYVSVDAEATNRLLEEWQEPEPR